MRQISDQVDKKEIEVILRELIRVMMSGVSGDAVEFGCYLGTTSVHIAKVLENTGRDFYVYDSFEGLPDKTGEDISPLGEPFKPGELCASKKQFIRNILDARVPMPIIKKAWFSNLTSDDVPEKVAFAFFDGDYYKSIADPLRLIDARLLNGAIVIIDDYGNPALPGAAKATDEWLARHPKYSKRIEHSLAIVYIKR
jgi:O-methyltransferase